MTEGLAWPPTKEDLERLYLVEGLSAGKVARVYGLKYENPKVAESTILYQLKRNGIKRRDSAEHVRKISEEMVDKWVTRYQAGESLKQIAGKELSPVSVFLHLRKRGIKLRDKVEAQIQAVRKYDRKPFRGDRIEKAYLMGLRHGDLGVVRHGRNIRVRVSTTHPAMAELFEFLFSPFGHVARYPRESKLTDYEWTLECDLDSSFDFLLQKVTMGELKAFGHTQFLAFLAGLFDAEGSIYLHRKAQYAFEISITNTDEKLLEFVARKLEDLGYHPFVDRNTQDESRLGYQKPGEIGVLRMYRQGEVCQLLGSLRFRHPEKAEKAAFVIKRICAPPMGVGQDEVEDWEKVTHRIKAARDGFVLAAKYRRERVSGPLSGFKEY